MSGRTRYLLALACLGLVTAAFLVACDDDSEGEDSPGSGDMTSAEATPTPEPAGGTGASGVPGGSTGTASPAPPGFPASDQPPVTTGSANGQTVEMGIGTYCWTLMCVDKIGVPTKGTLTIAAGDTVSIAVPTGAPPLREAGANAFEAVTPQVLDDGSEIWPYPGATGDALPATIDGGNVEVTVDLPAGRYVLAVGMYFEAGDAIYGVLLEVE